MQNTDEPGTTPPAPEPAQGPAQLPSSGHAEPTTAPTDAATAPRAAENPTEATAAYPVPPTHTHPGWTPPPEPQPAGANASSTSPGGNAGPAAGYAGPPAGGYAQSWPPNPAGYGYSSYPTEAPLPSGPTPTQAYNPGSNPPRARLTRSQDDRVISGVLGGLARYWNTDPLLLRILTIVLTIATGGALLLGYLIAWIVIPLEPSSPTGWPSGPATGFAAGGSPDYSAPGTPGTPGAHAEPFDSPPRPPRSYLGWLVVSIGLMVAGILAMIGLFFQPTTGFAAIICSIVLVVLGAGLIAGAWYGRARWLTILAVPMVFISMAAVAADSWVQSPSADRWIASDTGGITVGSRTWTVTPDDLANDPLDFRVSAGDAVLDLTELSALSGNESGRPGQRVAITTSVGLGQLVVRIPADMRLNLAGSVRAGQILLPGDEPGEHQGTEVSVDESVEPLGNGQPAYIVDLDAAIGAGNLEVRRAAS